MQLEQTEQYCQECEELVGVEQVSWLDLNTETHQYSQHQWPEGRSQGWFAFHEACAQKVLDHGGYLTGQEPPQPPRSAGQLMNHVERELSNGYALVLSHLHTVKLNTDAYFGPAAAGDIEDLMEMVRRSREEFFNRVQIRVNTEAVARKDGLRVENCVEPPPVSLIPAWGGH